MCGRLLLCLQACWCSIKTFWYYCCCCWLCRGNQDHIQTCPYGRVVHLYCKRNDQLATDVCKDLKDRLGKQSFVLQDKSSGEIDYNLPTMLVSFKTTRPLADVSEATNEEKEKFNNKMALVILHFTPDDPVVDGSSELVKGYEEYSKLGLLLDMGFKNIEDRYCLNKNNTAMQTLEYFFTK